MTRPVVLRRLIDRAGPSIWGLAIEVSGLFTSLATFFVLGNQLGAIGYGSLAAVLATITVAGPFITASQEHVVVQRIANDGDVARAWASSSSLLYLMAPIGAALISLMAVVIAPDLDWPSVFLVSAAELGLVGAARVAVRSQEASGRNQSGARLALLTLVFRIFSLVAFVWSGDDRVIAWAIAHFAFSLPLALSVHWIVAKTADGNARFRRPRIDDFRTGIPFALGVGPDSILSSNDRMVLSATGQAEGAGIYAAAYRVTSISGIATRSVVRTAYASYFSPENREQSAAIANARSVVSKTLPLGLMAAVGIVACAPLMTILLGDDFADSVQALRLLAFLPVIRSIQTPVANVLTGTGRQRLRVIGIVAAAILNLVLNLALIPSYGWQAAVLSTLAAECLLAAWVWFQVLRPWDHVNSVS